MTLELDRLPAFLWPRLRLFLSADLVGATKLKQQSRAPLAVPHPEAQVDEAVANWFRPIATFFNDFERLFANRWQQYAETIAPRAGWPAGPAPTVWKINGDEVIYVKEITEPEEAYAAVVCWLRTIVHMRGQVRGKDADLDIKGTAWIAGFPVANQEIVYLDSADVAPDIPVEGHPALEYLYLLDRAYGGTLNRRDYMMDYVGPGLDTGFRLAEIATPRRLPVSIDLALILSFITWTPFTRGTDAATHPIHFTYDGRHHLKGVMNDQPYPVFWIDTYFGDAFTELEDRMRRATAPENPRDVHRFAELYIDESPGHIFRPFFRATRHPELARRPETYDDRVNAIARKWADAKRLAGETAAGDEPEAAIGSATLSEAEMDAVLTDLFGT